MPAIRNVLKATRAKQIFGTCASSVRVSCHAYLKAFNYTALFHALQVAVSAFDIRVFIALRNSDPTTSD